MDSPSAAANSNATDSNAHRLAELAALVDAVKERVQSQYPETASGGVKGAINVGLPDLTPLARARDAAMGKMAAIGTVNPRAGGLVNNSIQRVKRAVSRALNWFVRDQVVFNRQMIAVVETCIETLADVNRTIHNLASQANIQIEQVRTEVEPLRAEARGLRAKTSQLTDLASHWHRWREEWQLKLHRNEVEFLKSVADLNTSVQQKIMHIESASQQRFVQAEAAFHQTHRAHAAELDASYRETALQLEAACQQTGARIESSFAGAVVPLEKSFRETLIQAEASFEQRLAEVESEVTAALAAQHAAFEQSTRGQVEALAGESRKSSSALERLLATSITDLQKTFYADLDRIRTEYERVIHAELRIVRQRLGTASAVPAAVQPVAGPASLPFDYARFADRFRGPEEYVAESQRFYVPFFTGRRHVLDIGCGRGEFLKLMREAGVPARGIEASEESVAYCRSQGFDASQADLFTYLSEQPETSLDGIFCSQVVEHLPPDRLPELVRLCAGRLATGGILAIETPNPECLAIFATHFYLDPTHTRPVPSQLLAFYMEEFGLGRIEVHQRSPAVESMPEVGELPEHFRGKFFAGLDYAIIARKL